MEPIPRQSRRLLWLLVFTVAWQAFAYGWIVTTAELRMTWPPSDLGRQIEQSWASSNIPPLGHYLNHLITQLAQNATNIPRMRVWIISFLSFLIHTVLVSYGLVIAGKYTRREASALWGYILTALNPFLMLLVAHHEWILLLTLTLGAAGYLSFLQERWYRGLFLFALATYLHPIMLFYIAIPVSILAHHPRRTRPLWAFLIGILAMWGGLALVIKGPSFIEGFSLLWFGGESWPDIGWNLFTFMKIISVPPRTTGYISLVLFILVNLVLIRAYKQRALSIRALPAITALVVWLLFWRSQFLQFGIALYWVSIYIAHRLDFYREPVILESDSADPV